MNTIYIWTPSSTADIERIMPVIYHDKISKDMSVDAMLLNLRQLNELAELAAVQQGCGIKRLVATPRDILAVCKTSTPTEQQITIALHAIQDKFDLKKSGPF